MKRVDNMIDYLSKAYEYMINPNTDYDDVDENKKNRIIGCLNLDCYLLEDLKKGMQFYLKEQTIREKNPNGYIVPVLNEEEQVQCLYDVIKYNENITSEKEKYDELYYLVELLNYDKNNYDKINELYNINGITLEKLNNKYAQYSVLNIEQTISMRKEIQNINKNKNIQKRKEKER